MKVSRNGWPSRISGGPTASRIFRSVELISGGAWLAPAHRSSAAALGRCRVLCCLIAVAIGPCMGAAVAQVPRSSDGPPAVVTAEEEPQLRLIPTQALHNVWQLSPRIYSGSEPESEAAFRELTAWGVRTIVSVDGIEPRVEMAKRFQMRYIHVPVGYDGIDPPAVGALTRVARDVQGKIYVHCHHGKHRGPAAAAILCRVDDGRTAAAAERILVSAGTGAEYSGLWRDVRGFQRPPDLANLPQLVEKAPQESLAAAMAKLDRAFEQLKLLGANRWQSLVDHPDIDAVTTSLQVAELLEESARVNTRPEMNTQLRAAGAEARQFSTSLRKLPDATSADAWLNRLQRQCVQCHQRFRNS